VWQSWAQVPGAVSRQSPAGHRARKWFIALIAALAAVLLLFAWHWYPGFTGSPPGPASGEERPERSQVYFGPGNSIAVLPFEDGSAASKQTYWSAGFSSELQRLLTRTSALAVTSRNSSFYFLDRSVSPRIVAERLQSSHLLAGEFQTDAGRLRVSARLYGAKKDKELWSRDYKQDLDSVFTVQEEILASVMEVMKLEQPGGSPRVERVDTEAWSFFLQGLFFRQQRTPDGFQKAEESFRSALEIEPAYERARVGLAGLWLERGTMGDTEESLVENAREALAATLRSRPDLAEAHGLISYLRRNYDWDWHGALEAAQQALSLSPGDPELMSTASLAMFTLGQFDLAGDLLRTSVSQDPLNLLRRLRLGLLQEFSGEYPQALSSYRQIIGLNPEFPGARAYRARVKIIQEKPDSAMRESEQEIDPFWKRYSRILALVALERHDEAELLLEQMIADDGHHAAYQVAEILAFRGDIDKAFEWIQRARQQKDGGMREILGNYFLRNLHGDPRWEEMLILLNLPLDLNR